LLRDENIEVGACRTLVGNLIGSSANRDGQVNLGVCLFVFGFREIDRGVGGGLRDKGDVGCEVERGAETVAEKTLFEGEFGLISSSLNDLARSTNHLLVAHHKIHTLQSP